MPFSLVSATADVSGVKVRAQFSEPFTQNSQIYERSNFTFTTRFGVDIALYTKLVTVVNSTTLDVTLQDVMLQAGHYQLTVRGVSALADGVPIEEGGGTNILPFEGVGEPKKSFDIRKRVPPRWMSRYGSTVHAILAAMGDLLESLCGESADSAISQAAKALLLRTATGTDLSIIGQNYGVARPDFALADDDLFRQLIPVFATKRKAVLRIFYEALTVVFGDSETAGWRIYVLRSNELVIEIPATLYFGLAPGSLASATYLHDGDSGTATGVGSGYLEDTSKSWATGCWTGAYLVDSTDAEFAVSSHTATRINVSGTPAAGAYTLLFFAPPSYAGDYFLADATHAGTEIDGNTILVFQQTVIDTLVTDLKAAGVEILVVIRG